MKGELKKFFARDIMGKRRKNMENIGTNCEKFTGKADVYQKFRPGYPEELYEYLCKYFIGVICLKKTLTLKQIWRIIIFI